MNTEQIVLNALDEWIDRTGIDTCELMMYSPENLRELMLDVLLERMTQEQLEETEQLQVDTLETAITERHFHALP